MLRLHLLRLLVFLYLSARFVERALRVDLMISILIYNGVEFRWDMGIAVVRAYERELAVHSVECKWAVCMCSCLSGRNLYFSG